MVFLDATGGYQKLVLPGSANGLAAPRVLDMSGDGVADRVYVGDLLGNVWNINISNTAAMQASVLYSAGASISTAPLVRRFAPNGTCTNCAMVNVVTGKPTLGPLLYEYSPGVHAAYGLWDKLDGTAIATSALVEQKLNATNPTKLTVTYSPVNYTDPTAPKRGWRMTLPTDEMGSANPVDRGDGVLDFFTAKKPGLSGTTCTATAGQLYALLAITGNAPPSTFDTNKDGFINAADLVSDGGATKVAVVNEAVSSNILGNVANVTSAASAGSNNVTADGNTKKQSGTLSKRLRMGWQELDR